MKITELQELKRKREKPNEEVGTSPSENQIKAYYSSSLSQFVQLCD